MSVDFFRPRSEPARSIYDAFQAEAEKRPKRAYESWLALESRAVWRAARDYAEAHGWPTPLLRDVARAQVSAMGYTDYGAKWAYRLVELMREQREKVNS